MTRIPAPGCVLCTQTSHISLPQLVQASRNFAQNCALDIMTTAIYNLIHRSEHTTSCSNVCFGQQTAKQGAFFFFLENVGEREREKRNSEREETKCYQAIPGKCNCGKWAEVHTKYVSGSSAGENKIKHIFLHSYTLLTAPHKPKMQRASCEAVQYRSRTELSRIQGQ